MRCRDPPIRCRGRAGTCPWTQASSYPVPGGGTNVSILGFMLFPAPAALRVAINGSEYEPRCGKKLEWQCE